MGAAVFLAQPPSNLPPMKAIPTDLEILNTIYEQYYDAYASYSDAKPNRTTKVYVPIDLQKLASEFQVDLDIIFGRLYYHLEKKYGYKDATGGHVAFFAMGSGGDRHCIHFPYAASILADMRAENRKYRIATTISVISIIIAITSFVISIARMAK